MRKSPETATYVFRIPGTGYLIALRQSSMPLFSKKLSLMRPISLQPFSAPLPDQIEVGSVVVVAEKGLLPAVAALEVMGISWCYDAYDSGHGWKVGDLGWGVS